VPLAAMLYGLAAAGQGTLGDDIGAPVWMQCDRLPAVQSFEGVSWLLCCGCIWCVTMLRRPQPLCVHACQGLEHQL
jgi:hypothetical protein